ncbi:MAG: tetratricopeptide repeat protein [Treponema sp.]|nr:tetratricopeptide repeat protein [Treponema sp.]
MKLTRTVLVAALCSSIIFSGCLTTGSLFDFDDEELSDYYYGQVKSGTEEKLDEKQKSTSSNSASSSSTSKTSSTSTAKKTETTDQKVERAKTLSKSSKLEDLETASTLIEEARAAEPWNMDLFDLQDQIDEKLFAAKIKEAERLYTSGTESELEKAITLVNEVLALRPTNKDADNLRIKINVKKANIIGEKVSIQQHMDEARQDIKVNSPDLAISKLEKVLAKEPNNSEAKTLVADARTLKARTLAMNKGHLDEAEKILNEALKDLPTHSGAKNLLAEIKELKKKAEECPFKVGSVYTLTSFTENGKTLPKTQWKPGHKLTFVSKTTVEENSQVFSSYGEYGFHVDTATRSIIFNNPEPRNVMYTKATYSADLKTIILCGIDIKGNLDGTVLVFTLK